MLFQIEFAITFGSHFTKCDPCAERMLRLSILFGL